jgi:hypothetical protein
MSRAVLAAELAADVRTPVGIYTPGTPVLLVQRRGPRALVCLDLGNHPADRCHAALVPTTSVRAVVTTTSTGAGVGDEDLSVDVLPDLTTFKSAMADLTRPLP